MRRYINLLSKKLLKKKEYIINCIPYPFRFIFKHQKEILNFKNVFFKLVGYYLKRIFKLKLDYESSSVLLIYSQIRLELPIDSLCEMDVIYEREVYDKQWKINKDSIVIDIGAHVGMFTLKVAKKVAKVIAVEPNTRNFDLLVRNIVSNNLTNVISLKLAVSDKIKEENLYLYKSSIGHSLLTNIGRSLFEKSDSYEKVHTITLDDLIKKDFEKIFIKINAEGAEAKILNGGKNILEASNVTLAVSIHSPLLKESVKKILRSHNFNVKEGELNMIHANKETLT